MKRVFDEHNTFSIQKHAKRLSRSTLSSGNNASVFPSWYNPGKYCGDDPAINVNSGKKGCSQPNYPALWSYRYGIAPLRNWFISNILYGSGTDVGSFVHPADETYNPVTKKMDDAFNSVQCGDSPSSLGSAIYNTQSVFRVENEPYWVAIISFFIALYFYGEKTKPKIPILGDRYPAIALALNAFISSYIGTWMKYNFWYPFVSTWLDLFGVSIETQEQHLMGPVMNTYFSFIISEITDNGPTSIDSAAITLIATLMKEQVIDSAGDYVYDSMYGNQNIIAPDGVSSGVDVNGINCDRVPQPPPVPVCAYIGSDGKQTSGCDRNNPDVWYPGAIFRTQALYAQQSYCEQYWPGSMHGCFYLPSNNLFSEGWRTNCPDNFVAVYNDGSFYCQCQSSC